MTSAERAFEATVRAHFDTGDVPVAPAPVADAALAVPSFVALEGRARQRPVRGWASAGGVVVLAPLLDYGPIVAALGLLQGGDVAGLAQRIAWSSGPSFVALEASPPDLPDLDIGPASRVVHAGGEVTLVFHLRDLDPEDPTIGRYVISASSAERCKVDVFELWPGAREPS